MWKRSDCARRRLRVPTKLVMALIMVMVKERKEELHWIACCPKLDKASPSCLPLWWPLIPALNPVKYAPTPQTIQCNATDGKL